LRANCGICFNRVTCLFDDLHTVHLIPSGIIA
jgi:hypothetical protein